LLRFKDYEKKVGPQTVLDLLNESDMDESLARAALDGDEDALNTSRVGSSTRSGRRSASRMDEQDDDEDEDFEDEGEERRRRSRRKRKSTTPPKKLKRETPAKDEDAAAPKAASSKKRSPPAKKVEEQAVVEGEASGTSSAAVVAAPSQPLRIPVTQEEALETEICRLEQELMAERAEEDPEGDIDEECLWKPPKWCVPIRADVRTFDFDALAKAQKELTGRLFDVIITDPPWQLATSNPTRGVALGYEQLTDNFIRDMPFAKLQDNGFLFMWVINAKYRFALSLFELWGYELVDEITWVKQTVNRRLAKSHGFYLQHAKETCLVGRKGNDPPGTNRKMGGGDIIFSERRGQSQKPTEIYEAIERLVPGGYYLEIFGRRNNTRDGFVTIGNEL